MRIRDVEGGGIVRLLPEAERGVPVGAEGAVAVVRDPPRPAQHAEVEGEEAARVATGEEDREERRNGHDEERQPQEGQDDVVRDEQEPLHEPQPAAQRLLQPAADQDGLLPCRRVVIGHVLPRLSRDRGRRPG